MSEWTEQEVESMSLEFDRVYGNHENLDCLNSG